ncbi:MAG TPA: Do family serine endopeptidase [Candidatus Latescibacteria bacterium]|nr:Do family serine endopeptidase [Candidatus Latescibacterota bacterium]HOF61831.1 Do family serine endopeptidase [Candidatus Latescibacterota bacterium]HOS65335.1 Do family serine endopeptidase [Candidatus Latescibacterota bacterium]HPK75040.1 Do family serine endopeptidase [Candidatus Latescibacterota bacterium]
MKGRRVLWAVSFIGVGTFIGLILASGSLFTHTPFSPFEAHAQTRLFAPPSSPRTPPPPSTATAMALGEAFNWAAERAIPAVVMIKSETTVKASQNVIPNLPDFFPRDLFPQIPDQSFRREGLGSGVIVSSDGYIVTNNHVIQGADKLTVVIGDDGVETNARVVGTDPRTDVAVIKVDLTNLPTLELGNSDSIKIGHWVVAIGSPFGEALRHTVTTGIVSALGRNIGIVDSDNRSGYTGFESFIQTDAAINPGNSGGALVDLRGRLIGINTAISSTSGSNSGVGFAIPINLVRDIARQLVENGRVSRGYLGVQIQQITPEIQNSLNLPDRHGALVGDVTSGGPAARAGIQRGDVIRTINGTAVKDMNDLRLRIASTPPGQQVRLGLWREGRERTVTATLDELPAEFQLPSERTSSSSRTGAVSRLGLTVTNASEATGRRGGEAQTGVLVTAVDPDSPAASRGLRQGDIIQEVNLQPVANVQEFERKIAAVKAGDSVLLLVKRDNSTLFIGVTIPN